MEDNNRININIEVRSTNDKPQAQNPESRRVVGYAIVFGVESRVLCDWDGSFIETIDAAAVTEDLIKRSDVKCVFNHNREKLLARSAFGEGTLQLFIDEKGLRYEFDAPMTSDGNDVLELVKRGDITGSSFAFTANAPGAIEYWKDKDGMPHRTVHAIDGLYDVSPVVDPAYTQTSVEARSWEPAPKPKEEPKHTEAIDAATMRRRLLHSTNITNR